MGLKLEWCGTSFPHRLLRGKDLALIQNTALGPGVVFFLCQKTAQRSLILMFVKHDRVKPLTNVLDRYIIGVGRC